MGRRTEHVPAATEADEKAFDEWLKSRKDAPEPPPAPAPVSPATRRFFDDDSPAWDMGLW